MKKFPDKGFVEKLLGHIRYISRLNIPVYAAHAGYFVVLAMFPTLVLLLGLLRYTGLAVQTLTDLLEGVIPEALMPSAKRLILSTYQNTSGTVVSISALTALWSASRGMYGLRTGLNALYHVSEDRGWMYTRSVSMGYTFLLLLVLLLTLILSVFSNAFLRMFPNHFLSQLMGLRFLVLVVVQTVFFAAIFMVLPNRRNRFFDSLPGAVLSALGWLVFSNLYSVYVEHFASYTNVFGSVYAVALSMLWLYCCISILFYGGALNYWQMEKT